MTPGRRLQLHKVGHPWHQPEAAGTWLPRDPLRFAMLGEAVRLRFEPVAQLSAMNSGGRHRLKTPRP